MQATDVTPLREMKLANGEVVKITEEEFQRVVDVFETLHKWDQELLLEAVNGSKLNLKPVHPERLKEMVGKNVFIAIRVKEELQDKQWDFYYKLERVRPESYSKKKNAIVVKNIADREFEVEARSLFVENDGQQVS